MIECKFPNGNPGRLRHVTCDAIAVKGEKILLVKRSNSAIFEPGKWATPGGYVDRDEIISEAVLRELFEETGYRGQIQFLLQINDDPLRVKTDDNQNITFFFVVKVGEKTGNPDHEVKKTAWFDLDNLPDKSEFGFDHFQAIQLYKKYLRGEFSLPIIGEFNE